MRSALLVCAVLSVGCDALDRELPGLFVAAPRTVEPESPTRTQRSALLDLARSLEHRLRPPAMPEPEQLTPCSGAATIQAATGHCRELVLANLDVRSQTKNLVPRRVSERLESGESAWLASLLENQVSDDTHLSRQDIPTSATSLTREDLQRIEQQRYLGVFYVTDYHGPALILRVGKIRREWYPGSLSARFVLYDTEAQRAVCATELRVTNDVKSAPIRKRLQSETRGRLERELGDGLRLQAERATSSFAQWLIWPESTTEVAQK